MSKKLSQQQLQQLSLDELNKLKEEYADKKAELLALKAKGGKAWTEEGQTELDEVALYLVDIEETIEAKANSAEEVTVDEYQPKKGTEKHIHLVLVRGRRFNPNTGKEESLPYTQLFTFSEWQVFKKHFRSLGYVITKVLHDPYNEAAKYVTQ
jgi:hypothetical protein